MPERPVRLLRIGLSRRQFLGLFLGGAAGAIGVGCQDDEKPKPQEVKFLFPRKEQLKVDEFNIQFGFIFEEGVKFLPEDWGTPLKLSNGNVIEGLIRFSSSDGERIELLRRTLNGNAEPKENHLSGKSARLQREIRIIDMVPSFQRAGEVYSEISYTLIEDRNPSKFVWIRTWPNYDSGPVDQSSQGKPTPGELFSLAKGLTEAFNWSVVNNQLNQ